MSKKKEAYVNWNAGVCRVIQYPSQTLICQGINFTRAVNKARRLGFYVRVFGGESGSYVLNPLPATKKQ